MGNRFMRLIAKSKDMSKMSPTEAFDNYFKRVDYTQDAKQLERRQKEIDSKKKLKEIEQRRASRSKGGGGGGTPTQFGASGKRGAEKMRKNPFDLNKGGKVKFSRGGGVATQGTKFSRNG